MVDQSEDRTLETVIGFVQPDGTQPSVQAALSGVAPAKTLTQSDGSGVTLSVEQRDGKQYVTVDVGDQRFDRWFSNQLFDAQTDARGTLLQEMREDRKLAADGDDYKALRKINHKGLSGKLGWAAKSLLKYAPWLAGAALAAHLTLARVMPDYDLCMRDAAHSARSVGLDTLANSLEATALQNQKQGYAIATGAKPLPQDPQQRAQILRTHMIYNQSEQPYNLATVVFSSFPAARQTVDKRDPNKVTKQVPAKGWVRYDRSFVCTGLPRDKAIPTLKSVALDTLARRAGSTTRAYVNDALTKDLPSKVTTYPTGITCTPYTSFSPPQRDTTRQ